MRLVILFAVLAVLITSGIIIDTRSREQAFLDGRVQVLETGLEAVLGGITATESAVHGLLLDDPEVVGLIGTLATGAADDSQTQTNRLRAALHRHVSAALGSHGGPIRQALTIYDSAGRILTRFIPGTAAHQEPTGFRPSLAKALDSGRPVTGFESGPAVHGFRILTPVTRQDRLIAVLESAVPYHSLAATLKTGMPEGDFAVLVRRSSLLNPLSEQDEAAMEPSALGPDHLRAPVPRGAGLAMGLAVGDQANAAMEGLDSADIATVGDGKPVARFSSAPHKPGAIALLPLHDPSGTWTATLAGYWPGSEQALIFRWLIGALAGGLGLLTLLFAAMIVLRRTLTEEDHEHRQLVTVTDTMSAGLYVVDGTKAIVMVNAAACRILGYAEHQMVGRDAHTLFHVHSKDAKDAGPLAECPIYQSIRNREPLSGRTMFFRHKDGHILTVDVSCSLVDHASAAPASEAGDAADTLPRRARHSWPRRAATWLLAPSRADAPKLGAEAVVSFEDVTERRNSEAAILKLNKAVEQSSASVVITDARGCIEYVNPAFCEISGYSKDEAIGQSPSILKSGRLPEEFYQELWTTISAGKEWRGEFHNRRKDGSLYWERATISPVKDDLGRITHYVAVKDDVTQRKEIEEELFHRANYDPLTGLPNRQLLIDRLTTSLAVARRENQWVAVMFLDLDRFKQVNDTLGHNAGDVLLKQAASRLAAVLRPQDTLGRLGGDEFLVVAPGLHREIEATTIANRLLEVARQPFTVDGREVYVSASIGVSLGPVDGANPQVLMRNADAAMYQAKDAGRDGYHYFTPEVEAASRRRMMVENGLRTAVRDGSLHLVYQPIFSSGDHRIMKAEALIRWVHPQLGAVPPSEFIDIAEETGQILTLGSWVLEESCRALANLNAPRDGSFRIGINISSKQFSGDLHAQVAEALRRHDLDPRMLEIEITERLLLHPSEDVRDQIEALRHLGVSIAIDDFGTGYSAMSYLTVFTIDTLKIDRSFVAGLVNDPRAQALITAIIGMAHGLDCRVVAEGVETEQQASLLSDMGVDALQGYLLGRPSGLDTVQTLLVRRDSAPVSETASGPG